MGSLAERVTSIVEQAVLVDGPAREALLAQACGPDSSLRQQVEAALAAVERPLVLDAPVEAVAAELLYGHDRDVIGSRIGPYRINALIGAGGMGEVYRASDVVLERQVAIKLLPSGLANDPDRVSRFRRESKALAALNHPNIAAIYGLQPENGRDDEPLALVLELVDGPTLAEKLADGPLRLHEALSLARQLADALDAAHQQGVVHRDLKPANLKVREDGTLKVLDFGLAKLAASIEGSVDDAGGSNKGRPASVGSGAHTYASPAVTAVGTIVGTAAYMSPEQARGKAVDKRADIWAFGAVVYEMVAGRAPFSGRDIPEVLAAVINEEPDWTPVPMQVRPLLERCLEKEPRRRLRDIGDALPLLDAAALPVPAAARGPRLPWFLTAAAAVTAVATLTTLTLRTSDAALDRREIPALLADGWEVDVAGARRQPRDGSPLALSPDGRYIALMARPETGDGAIIIRDFRDGSVWRIPGTADASSMFWKPDSTVLAFAVGNEFRKVDAEGGPVQTITQVTGNIVGATWGADDTIVFASSTTDSSQGLRQITARGGRIRPAFPNRATDAIDFAAMPSFLPDGRHLLYVGYSVATFGTPAPYTVYVQALDSGTRVELLTASARNVVYASGHLLFVRGGSLFAQRFDADRLELVGDSFAVADGVQTRGGTSPDGFFTASQDGMLLYQPGTSETATQLTWRPRDGGPPHPVGQPATFRAFSLSKDDRFAVASLGNGIAIYDLERGTPRMVLRGEGYHNSVIWSPQGDAIAFMRSESRRNAFGDVFVKRLDGPDKEQRLVEGPDAQIPADWHGDSLLYVQGTGRFSNNDIWVRPMAGGAAYRLIATDANETRPQVSPDGRLLAYGSNEFGQMEIYVAPFEPRPPSPAEAGSPRTIAGFVPVSRKGGTSPRWSGNGRELFYIEPATGTIMAVTVSIEDGTIVLGTPQPTITIDVDTGNNSPFEVSHDGQRFLLAVRQGSAPSPTKVVFDWFLARE